jgi:hypothetical protein
MSVTAGDFLQSEAIYKKLPADKQTTHSSHDPKRVEQKPPVITKTIAWNVGKPMLSK